MWHIFIHLSLEEHLGCSSVLAIVNSAAVNMGVLIPLRCPVFISLGCILNFPDSSAFKESACSLGDPGSILGSERSTGDGIGYPLQYSWASLMAQMVKNLPAMQETWVRSLGWENPLEKGKATHSSILAWRIPWTV